MAFPIMKGAKTELLIDRNAAPYIPKSLISD